MPRSFLLTRLIDPVLQAIEEIGINNVIGCLKREIKKSQAKKNPDAVFIVALVCNNMQLCAKEIYSGKGRKNDRIYALGFCTLYLHHSLCYDMEFVKFMLQKDEEWILYKYSKLIKELDEHNPNDRPFCELKKKMDTEVTEYMRLHKPKKSVKNVGKATNKTVNTTTAGSKPVRAAV